MRSHSTATEPTTEPRVAAPGVEEWMPVLGVPLARGALEVADARVELWSGALPAEPAPPEVWALLSAEERERVARLRIPDRAIAATWSRALLRAVLSRYLACPAHAVQLAPGVRGKPACVREHAGTLEFNISHSAGALLIGVCATHRVGVDVERVRPIRHVPALVARALGPVDRARFLAATDAGLAEHEAFVRVWTIVEARAKALGTGVEVHGAGDMPQLEGLPCVRLVGPVLADGHVGAVAVVP